MYKLTDSFPYLLTRVGVRMGDLFSKRVASYGVTLPMYRVMAAILETPGQRLNDLCAMTSIEISTLSRLVGSMEKLGFIERSRLPGNARTVSINLTHQGKVMVKKLLPIASHFEDMAVAGFSKAQLTVLKNSLESVYENLDILETEVNDILQKNR